MAKRYVTRTGKNSQGDITKLEKAATGGEGDEPDPDASHGGDTTNGGDGSLGIGSLKA